MFVRGILEKLWWFKCRFYNLCWCCCVSFFPPPRLHISFFAVLNFFIWVFLNLKKKRERGAEKKTCIHTPNDFVFYKAIWNCELFKLIFCLRFMNFFSNVFMVLAFIYFCFNCNIAFDIACKNAFSSYHILLEALAIWARRSLSGLV